MICSESWEETMAQLLAKPQAVIAVVGPKGSGKSAFARELFTRANKQQPKACFIETDLGRPEFVFPGVLSVHSSNSSLVGGLFLGEDEPSQRPQEYLAAVGSVCEFATRKGFEFQVVNTNGWVTLGQGQDILEGVLQAAKVTDVVEIIPTESVSASLVRDESTNLCAFFMLHKVRVLPNRFCSTKIPLS
jgi:polynucleotide 5'-kinase involved in rRNA processing